MVDAFRQIICKILCFVCSKTKNRQKWGAINLNFCRAWSHRAHYWVDAGGTDSIFKICCCWRKNADGFGALPCRQAARDDLAFPMNAGTMQLEGIWHARNKHGALAPRKFRGSGIVQWFVWPHARLPCPVRGRATLCVPSPSRLCRYQTKPPLPSQDWAALSYRSGNEAISHMQGWKCLCPWKTN